MSMIKRYIEDKCEEIAKEKGCDYDTVLACFNFINERGCGDKDSIFDAVRMMVEALHKAYDYSYSDDPILSGVIPVEYHYYKELTDKALAYDKIMKYISDLGGELNGNV